MVPPAGPSAPYAPEQSMSFGDPALVPATDAPTLELARLFAACVEPRQGGPLMKALGPVAPLNGLAHIKRVRKSAEHPAQLEILLCPVGGGGPADEAAAAAADGDGGSLGSGCLPAAVRDAIADQQVQRIFVAQVSRHAPGTREQAAEWGRLWPISWRPPDPGAHANIAAPPPAEADAMRMHVRRAWRLLQQADVQRQEGDQRQNGAQPRHPAGTCCNACVIVDPASNRAVAEAVDRRDAHPLHHAAMLAVAAVAEWQVRVWPGDEQPQAQQLQGAARHVQQQQQQQQEVHDREAHLHARSPSASSQQELEDGGKRRRVADNADVRGGVAAAAATTGRPPRPPSGAANGQRQHQQQQQQAEPPDAEMVEPAAGAAAATAGAAAGAAPLEAAPPPPNGELPQLGGGPGPRPYLCTGYDAYLAREPCVMCAMALVHSRLRRVVYCEPDNRCGALGGALRLHSQRSLNHHYTVYRLPLLEDSESKVAAAGAEGAAAAAGRAVEAAPAGGCA